MKEEISQSLKKAIFHHKANKLDLAEKGYREVIAKDRKCADALSLLGTVVSTRGQISEAIELNLQALEISPGNHLYHHELGVLYYLEKKFDLALNCFEKVTDLDPLHFGARRLSGAILYAQGKYNSAIDCNNQALALNQESFEVYYNLGLCYYKVGRYKSSEDAYKKAITLNSGFHSAYTNLGSLYNIMRNFESAESCWNKAIELCPESSKPYISLGMLYRDQGHMDDARKYLQKGNSQSHSDGMDLAIAVMQPPIYSSQQQIQEVRNGLLKSMDDMQGKIMVIHDPVVEIGIPNFYSAYHGFNERDLNLVFCNLIKTSIETPHFSLNKNAGEGKIKIGIISRYIKDHTIGKFIRGIIAELSRERFEIIVLSAGDYDDEISRFVKSNCNRFVPIPNQIYGACKTVVAQELDILFYSDIGMDPLTYYLAYTRLAPIQCVSWGHPVTTGINEIDYFISSRMIEPENAQEHYTEKLVMLTRLPSYYYPPEIQVTKRNRAEFGLPEHANIYMCPQTLMKLHPDFDELMDGILSLDPEGVIVLIRPQHKNWTELLFERLGRTMPDTVNRVLLTERCKFKDFMALLGTADLLLDPLHFGGGNTTYESFYMGIPIVTLPGEFMRGRVTLGCYRQMGLTDCIAFDKKNYVSIAVKLGTDNNFNTEIRNKILNANSVLFKDEKVIEELENFFVDAVSRVSG